MLPSPKELNELGYKVEQRYNESTLDLNVDFLISDFKFLNEGQFRAAFSDEQYVLKVAKNEEGLAQNKLEVFICSSAKDSRLKRHLPKYFTKSSNYWVIGMEYIDGKPAEWKDFYYNDDIYAMKCLALDQDLLNNVLWSISKNTWVVIDLGMCWHKQDLPKIIEKLKNNESIEDFAL